MKWWRGRLSKDQLEVPHFCLVLVHFWLAAFDRLGDAIAIATDWIDWSCHWCHLMVGIDGTCWMPLAGIDHCCRLLSCLCSLLASLCSVACVLEMGPDWLGLHPSEASCCFCPLLGWCCWAEMGPESFCNSTKVLWCFRSLHSGAGGGGSSPERLIFYENYS